MMMMGRILIIVLSLHNRRTHYDTCWNKDIATTIARMLLEILFKAERCQKNVFCLRPKSLNIILRMQPVMDSSNNDNNHNLDQAPTILLYQQGRIQPILCACLSTYYRDAVVQPP
jgi:hypothetical protein